MPGVERSFTDEIAMVLYHLAQPLELHKEEWARKQKQEEEETAERARKVLQP